MFDVRRVEFLAPYLARDKLDPLLEHLALLLHHINRYITAEVVNERYVVDGPTKRRDIQWTAHISMDQLEQFGAFGLRFLRKRIS